MTPQELIREYQGKGCDRLSLEILGAHVLNISRASFLARSREPLAPEDAKCLYQAYVCLSQGTPLQYLVKTAWFWGRAFYVDERVLIPRFDTEVLVNQALKDLSKSASHLDLCCGSGIIPLTLKAERPDICSHASDISADALMVARINAERFGLDVEWRQGDLTEPWQGKQFDLITSNPPYISSSEMAILDQEVRKEPHLALKGGEDGLDFYRRLAEETPPILKEGGILLLEIGWKQGETVARLMEEAAFEDVSIQKDSQGLDRLVRAIISS